jgi:hypothetical protein
MGKYSTNSRQAPVVRRNSIHGVMRGIGCVLFVIVPIMAYGLAALVVAPSQSWGIVPVAWYQEAQLNPTLAKLQGVNNAWTFLTENLDLTIANLIFTFVLMIVIYGVLSVIYGYIFAMAAPSRYGPTDVPPPRVKTKKYNR